MAKERAYWIITCDVMHEAERVNDEVEVVDLPSRVGRSGPYNADTSLPLTLHFRLSDGDGFVHYLGLAANDLSLEYAHEFGMADTGATDLQVFEVKDGRGSWVQVY